MPLNMEGRFLQMGGKAVEVTERKLPAIVLGGTGSSRDDGRYDGAIHDPLVHPKLYEGVALRRTFAFLVDMVLIAIVLVLAFIPLGVVTALLAIPATVLVSVAYDALTIGGHASATPGMRLFGLQVISWSGGKPDNLQAFLMSIVFWAIHGVTSWLAAVVVFLNPRWRAAHDFCSGTVVVRADAWKAIS
jgi:uncharacterized RDD family membrane protein YckC